jgi:hypothetical protein
MAILSLQSFAARNRDVTLSLEELRVALASDETDEIDERDVRDVSEMRDSGEDVVEIELARDDLRVHR